MTLTDLIAFLALIVAIYSAIVSTYAVINEFFRLRLSYLGKSYITLSKTNNYINDYGVQLFTYDKDLYTIALLIRIENKSKNPITINDFILNDTYICNSSSTKFDGCLATSFSENNGKLFDYETMHLDNDIIQPLLTIRGLSTYEGYLVFNNLKELPSEFAIKICTVQKSKIFHLKFSITNDYRSVRKS